MPLEVLVRAVGEAWAEAWPAVFWVRPHFPPFRPPCAAYELRPTWADEAISQVQNAGRKGQVRGSKGPSFLLAGSARRGFLAPRAKAHAGFS